MTVMLNLALVPFVLGLGSSTNPPAVDDHAVAIVAGTPIQHSMIVCGPLLRDDRPRCHEAEQSSLDDLIIGQWIDAAVKLQHVALTPKEKQEVEDRLRAQQKFIIAAGTRFHRLAALVLRLHEGADRAAVYEQAAKEGLTATDIAQEIALLPTLAMAKQAAAADFVADTERSLRESFTREFVLRHLRDVVRKRAGDHGQSFDDAAAELWSNVAKLTSTKVVDAEFHLPDAKRILGSS